LREHLNTLRLFLYQSFQHLFNTKMPNVMRQSKMSHYATVEPDVKTQNQAIQNHQIAESDKQLRTIRNIKWQIQHSI
jgi:hypothetical protein